MIRIDGNAQYDQKELSAYIQQQMNELTPHLEPNSPIEIKLRKKDDGFEVEVTTDHLSGVVQTLGWNENIFHAIKSAKEGLLQYFAEVEDELNPNERDEKINHISRHGNLYLH